MLLLRNRLLEYDLRGGETLLQISGSGVSVRDAHWTEGRKLEGGAPTSQIHSMPL